jgi:hypothetical protein
MTDFPKSGNEFVLEGGGVGHAQPNDTRFYEKILVLWYVENKCKLYTQNWEAEETQSAINLFGNHYSIAIFLQLSKLDRSP